MEPFTFAIGRLFHDDPAVVPLLLARQQLLANATGPRKALSGQQFRQRPAVARNLLAQHRHGIEATPATQTTARFRNEVDGEELRRLHLRHGHFPVGRPSQHARSAIMVCRNWDEPMRPSLVFLQSCLALKEAKVQPLLSRGAVAVVGSSTRTYSASGGACSLAFFDALLTTSNRSAARCGSRRISCSPTRC